MDDCVTNDNKDRNKILATVAATIYEFTIHYPEKYVFFTGSTPERTRLYRMAISNNLEELTADYEIYGVQWDSGTFMVEPFLKGKSFFGFIIKRRNH